MPLVEVKTKQEEQEFQSILSRGWKENDWEQYTIKGQNFLFKNGKGESFATITFLKYTPDRQSFVNHIYRFDQVEPIKNNIPYTIELDHFTVLNEKRSIKTLLRCVKEVSKEVLRKKEIKYCIAIMEPRFYNWVKRILGTSMVALSEPIYTKQDNCYFIPFYVDVEMIRHNLRKLKLVSV